MVVDGMLGWSAISVTRAVVDRVPVNRTVDIDVDLTQALPFGLDKAVVVVTGTGGDEHSALDAGGLDARTAELHPLGVPTNDRGKAHAGLSVPTLGCLNVNAIDRH